MENQYMVTMDNREDPTPIESNPSSSEPNSVPIPVLVPVATSSTNSNTESEVVSEAAFSTGGRILDPFRSSLSPSTVQALVCCQNWLNLASIPINISNYMDYIENSEMIESEFGESLKISTDCL
ncbi:uncharacterized protein LOC133673315 [Populus nigra]|uniref:uncharacterized protein LOC133673315 n=1 Tax=Populus nigra TaxID=3691 RepID=UPI002B278F26|nr:uncharacterized protein LOC133673315 [Populus nigra]